MSAAATLTRTSASSDSWKADGLCAQADPEIFFPLKGGSTRQAKLICQGCPVREQCLEWAMATGEPDGIWGGTSPRERRKLRAASAQAADLVQAS